MVDINRQMTRMGVEGNTIIHQIKINNEWCRISLEDVDVIQELFNKNKYNFKKKVLLISKLAEDNATMVQLMRIFYPFFYYKNGDEEVVFYDLLLTKLKTYHNIMLSDSKVRLR